MSCCSGTVLVGNLFSPEEKPPLKKQPRGSTFFRCPILNRLFHTSPAPLVCLLGQIFILSVCRSWDRMPVASICSFAPLISNSRLAIVTATSGLELSHRAQSGVCELMKASSTSFKLKIWPNASPIPSPVAVCTRVELLPPLGLPIASTSAWEPHVSFPAPNAFAISTRNYYNSFFLCQLATILFFIAYTIHE